ncbi:hypothetical protein AVEN_111682-1 [Araneus ventricosus]|uniref:C2H2-type domain-containing protein n=1 Tax=Araneus ventricosus TaxID=182803 RepID=A0A4Y2Q6S2_ARAVE|nr:hypothetical protein AVEN_111682-1 [Araneus ventricosus]
MINGFLHIYTPVSHPNSETLLLPKSTEFVLQYCAIQDFCQRKITVCRTVEGLKAPINRADSENYKFPSLFAAQILKAGELLPLSVGGSYKVLPYDLYCPSVQSVLPTRVCKHCGLYFASNVMLKKHIVDVHKITRKCQPEVGRIRPLRIARRRQQELMAVIAFTENVKFADWVDEDDIDLHLISFVTLIYMNIYKIFYTIIK